MKVCRKNAPLGARNTALASDPVGNSRVCGGKVRHMARFLRPVFRVGEHLEKFV